MSPLSLALRNLHSTPGPTSPQSLRSASPQLAILPVRWIRYRQGLVTAKALGSFIILFSPPGRVSQLRVTLYVVQYLVQARGVFQVCTSYLSRAAMFNMRVGRPDISGQGCTLRVCLHTQKPGLQFKPAPVYPFLPSCTKYKTLVLEKTWKSKERLLL